MSTTTLATRPVTDAPTTLTTNETWYLYGICSICVTLLTQTLQGDGAPLTISLAFSGLAFATAYALIRWLGASFMRVGLKGKDMSKVRKTQIPETMGAVCAVVYLLAIIVFIPFPFYKDIVAATSGGGSRDEVIEVTDVNVGRHLQRFPHNKLATYLSAILSLQSVVILGLGDDLFDIRWRHKVLIPAFASIPMLVVYFVDFGVTSVVVPTVLRPYFGDVANLGWIYYAYMSLVSIFAPNSINILAGINGLEVSQSVAIACLILLNDLFYLPSSLLVTLLTSSSHLKSLGVGLSLPSTPLELTPAQSAHLSSIYLLLPFLAVSLALLLHNWYPAKVFVGDTYCYFAGMVFAVVAIQGHFSKTLLLLMVPQIINFVYSVPQLFHLVPIPRHRLPHFVEVQGTGEGVLEASWVDFGGGWSGSGVNGVNGKGNGTANVATRSKTAASATNGTSTSITPLPSAPTTPGLPKYRPTTPPRRPKAPVQLVLKLLHKFRLIDIETDSSTGEVLRCTNMTLINLWLVWRGPMREDRLCAELTALQVCFGLLGLWVRHRLALWVFPIDNL